MPSRRPGKNARNNVGNHPGRPVNQKRKPSEGALRRKLSDNRIHPGAVKVKKTTSTKKKIKPPARKDRRNK